MILKSVLIMGAIFTYGFAVHAEEKMDLVTNCKQECPKAKTDEDAHKCAEKNGRLNKDFRKSKCYEANEKYEKSLDKSNESKK